ncbi:hypothetical protein QTP70_000999 [Hemibagrus guttatus]|uniref:ribonuclease H n=1 Tax=Hemibagrus guttatus TaxID=175788 RepID=A0AAE0QFG3_9TELE|nr:hypothetical protein QTP70_000999 [Hemibagrus guttatus]
MDQLSEEVRQESPWTMMFADDIVICSESREQVEENLERWRFAMERRGMKVSRSKTEYMCVNEREGSGTVRLQGEEVKKVQEFKYLGSTVQSNGECGKEVKKRVQAGWNGWRKVSGVLCNRKISARIKGKVYRTVVRPAMMYGLETVSLRKRQESELEVAELKMLRFSLGVTRLDRIRNEYIRGTTHVGRLGDKVREARLRWFGHVQRRESEDSFELHSVDLELEAIEKQIRDLQVKQAQLQQRKAVLKSSRTDTHLSQVGCELEEKERFWSELDEVMESIPMGERVVIGADFNGHVGEGNIGDVEVMGKFGVKERSPEGQMVVDIAKRMDMAVVNTYFQKREEHRVTYKSGGVAEKYVRVVQDMYERSRTVVRCAVGQTEEFKVEVGLHQGLALSPFLFAMVMDQLSEEVRQESPWTIMFADDIVICSESRDQVEENLKKWRFALERRGMKVSRSKTEYMCVNEREGSGTVRLQGEEVKKVQEFKYLGSTVQSNGVCGKEVKKRVQAGWNGWRKVSGVLCDKKISARIKGKVYRTMTLPPALPGDTKAFPGQPRDIVSPACPGSSPGSLPSGACPEHLPRETSRRHPEQMPEPPQLALFNVEEQWLYSKLLPGDRAPYPISKGAPCHPMEKTHFGRLNPVSCTFGHDPKLMTIG